jgi:hypothetical protein
MEEGTTGGFHTNALAHGALFYNYGTVDATTVNNYLKGPLPTTQTTAKAVATLAYASKIFRDYGDTAYANLLWDAALRGWGWILANPNSTNDGSASHT